MLVTVTLKAIVKFTAFVHTHHKKTITTTCQLKTNLKYCSNNFFMRTIPTAFVDTFYCQDK